MIRNYPDDSDVKEVISNKVPFRNIREFFQKRGIFYIYYARNKIAEHSCRLFLGYSDYKELKDLTDASSNTKKVSGIEITTKLNQDEILEKLKELKGVCLNKDDKLMVENIQKREDGTILVDISYEHRNVGTVELLKRDPRSFQFEIKPKQSNNGKTVIIIHHNTNEDYVKAREVLRVVKKKADEENENEEIRIEEIKLERLPLEKRIELFDRILTYVNHGDWTLEDVISLKIRRDDSLDDEELEEAELRGITEAILKGRNLRTNKTVKKFEKSGYYFSSVIIKLRHTKDPIKIHLKIAFKSRPELPEVEICECFEVTDDIEEPKVLPPEEQDRIVKYFWDILEKTYYELIES